MTDSPLQEFTPRSTFPATRWSLIVSSRGRDTRACLAMEELCRTYWYPIYGFARRAGLSPKDSEDTTQEFFEKMIREDMLARVAPESGKLRSYFIASLKNHIVGQRRRDSAKKRGGHKQFFSIDQDEAEGRYRAELVDGESPEHAFERQWALAILDAVIARLRKEYARRNDSTTLETLMPLLVDSERGEGFREAAQQLGKNEGTVRVATFRLRKRYRKLVREEISETVDPGEVDAEIDALFAILAH